ncbi:ATP-binding cassette domain-containing protein [Rheinheimera muenzenbergensis]|uniref:ATP-binding cassette domain-containing protein n=1 Tax=Rheinheimera muenzenbergensis TaxID=1193628 RepID=A0ABU8C591_9GAMM
MSLQIKRIATKPRQNFKLDLADIVIEPMECVSVVGANGSGKTTLLESVLGMAPTLQRDVWLFGQPTCMDERDFQLRRKLGVQLQKSQFNRKLLVSDLISLHKVVYRRSCKDIAELFQLKALLPMRYERLSRGQKQRVDLYLAFAHQPEFILLDEPGTGLDAEFRNAFIQLLQQVIGKSAGVLMVSHQESEILLSHRTLVLQAGKVVHFAPAAALVKQFVGTHKIEFECYESRIADEIICKARVMDSVVRAQLTQHNKGLIFTRTNIINALVNDFGSELFSKIALCESSVSDMIAN